LLLFWLNLLTSILYSLEWIRQQLYISVLILVVLQRHVGDWVYHGEVLLHFPVMCSFYSYIFLFVLRLGIHLMYSFYEIVITAETKH